MTFEEAKSAGDFRAYFDCYGHPIEVEVPTATVQIYPRAW